MRISNGSKGTSRNGGNIFHHNRLFLVANPRTNRKQAPPPIEIAPIEVRNAVYQELIRRSQAVKYYSQLIDGPCGLLSRGLGETETENYGALPRTHKERAGLAHTLNKFLKVRFPEYAVRSTHAAMLGVPGFWQDESGNLQLWNPRDYNMPLLVIPYRDDQGRNPSLSTSASQKRSSHRRKEIPMARLPVSIPRCEFGHANPLNLQAG
jgi:hypothetical protein